MSIRPSYRKRSVVQVLAHGMNAHPPTGRSCCDEAALTANELARRNEELSEAQDKIAALKRMTARMADERNRNVEAKFEALAERDEARGSRDYWIDLYGELRDELQAKLDAAEGWPDWLGPRVDPDDYEVTVDDGGHLDVEGIPMGLASDSTERRRLKAKNLVLRAAREVSAALHVESEQAATGDEDQRVEEVAERATEALVGTILNFFNVEDDDGAARATARSIVREARDAGWTPPESEREK